MLSAFNALTLSPGARGSVAAAKPEEGTYKRRGPLGKFFDVFNRLLGTQYEWFCPLVARGNSQGRARAGACWQSSGLGAFFFGSRLPSSFMPDEDQGYIYVSMQLPIGRQWNAQARLRNR